MHLGLIYVGHGRVDIISVCGQEESWAVGGCYPSMETLGALSRLTALLIKGRRKVNPDVDRLKRKIPIFKTN